MLLAIDTATRSASLALYDGASVRAEVTWEIYDHHTVELLPRIAWMMGQVGVSEHDLSGLAVSIGPGSFTGLRIGLAIAKGLALANELPLVGVPTLDVLAYAQKVTKGPMLVALQAGRGKLAVMEYRRSRGAWRARGEPRVTTIERLIEQWAAPMWLCGELEASERALLLERLGERVMLIEPASALRRAGFLAELGWRRIIKGEVDDMDRLSPIYLPTAGVNAS